MSVLEPVAPVDITEQIRIVRDGLMREQDASVRAQTIPALNTIEAYITALERQLAEKA